MCTLVFSEAAALAIDDSDFGILTRVWPCFFVIVVIVIANVISTHIVYNALIVDILNVSLDLRPIVWRLVSSIILQDDLNSNLSKNMIHNIYRCLGPWLGQPEFKTQCYQCTWLVPIFWISSMHSMYGSRSMHTLWLPWLVILFHGGDWNKQANMTGWTFTIETATRMRKDIETEGKRQHPDDKSN